MRSQGLAGVHRRRSKRFGGSKRLHPLFDDLIERNFDPAGPPGHYPAGNDLSLGVVDQTKTMPLAVPTLPP